MRKNSPKAAEEAEVAEEAAAAVVAVEAVVTVEVAELDVVTASHVHRLTDREVAESRAEAKLCLTRTISLAFERSLRL
jgi:hypothetical protein